MLLRWPMSQDAAPPRVITNRTGSSHEPPERRQEITPCPSVPLFPPAAQPQTPSRKTTTLRRWKPSARLRLKAQGREGDTAHLLTSTGTSTDAEEQKRMKPATISWETPMSFGSRAPQSSKSQPAVTVTKASRDDLWRNVVGSPGPARERHRPAGGIAHDVGRRAAQAPHGWQDGRRRHLLMAIDNKLLDILDQGYGSATTDPTGCPSGRNAGTSSCRMPRASPPPKPQARRAVRRTTRRSQDSRAAGSRPPSRP